MLSLPMKLYIARVQQLELIILLKQKLLYHIPFQLILDKGRFRMNNVIVACSNRFFGALRTDGHRKPTAIANNMPSTKFDLDYITLLGLIFRKLKVIHNLYGSCHSVLNDTLLSLFSSLAIGVGTSDEYEVAGDKISLGKIRRSNTTIQFYRY